MVVAWGRERRKDRSEKQEISEKLCAWADKSLRENDILWRGMIEEKEDGRRVKG